MKYLIYEMSMKAPEPEEIRLVWSILLLGKQPVVASRSGWALVVLTEFNNLSWERKAEQYNQFRILLERQLPFSWDELQDLIVTVGILRKKKQKNGMEMKMLTSAEVVMRRHEKWFIELMTYFLASFRYDQLIPLTAHLEPPLEDEVRVIIPLNELNLSNNGTAGENYVTILADALGSLQTMLVLDNRLDPFIETLNIADYSGPSASSDGRINIGIQKMWTMPLCYTLKTNEIRLVRNEFNVHFHEFGKAVEYLAISLAQTDNATASAELVRKALEIIIPIRDKLQKKIDNNVYIHKAANELSSIKRVNIYLALASSGEILKLMNKASMIDEEGFLYASDMITQQPWFNNLKPFFYVSMA